MVKKILLALVAFMFSTVVAFQCGKESTLRENSLWIQAGKAFADKINKPLAELLHEGNTIYLCSTAKKQFACDHLCGAHHSQFCQVKDAENFDFDTLMDNYEKNKKSNKEEPTYHKPTSI